MNWKSLQSSKKVVFKLHPKQQEAWKLLKKEKKRTVALISGVQGGKTSFGAIALRHEIQNNKDPNAAWLVGAPTYKILNQSTLPTFKKVFGNLLGNYNGQDGCYHLKDGRDVWFRTATDPDSVEGVPNCVFGWMDEAGKCSRRFWINFEARLARCQGQMLLTTTWYSLNWLYKSIWQPYVKGDRSDIGLVYFNSAENPSFPNEELERQRSIMSRAEFSRKFLGQPAKPEGLVFSEFNQDNWCDPFKIDYSTVPTYMGLDYGFDHPMAMVIRAIPGDGNCYTVSAFKKSGLSVKQQLDAIRSKANLFHVKHIYGGHDRPDILLELNKLGLRACKYFEGNNNLREVNVGNQLHDELIRTNRYRVFRDIEEAEDLEDEYLTYSWDKSEDGEQNAREKPININDDLIAADRYCTVGTNHLMKQKVALTEIPNALGGRIDTWSPDDIADEGKTWMDY